MKAAVIDGYGDESNIVVREMERPTAGAGQLLVRVLSAGVNPFDATVLAGQAMPSDKTNFPLILGQDFAGIVEAVGQDVSQFMVNDRVYGSSSALFGGSGAFAEYLLVNSDSVGNSAFSVSDDAMATLPTPGAAALQALNEMNLGQDSKLFIHGGAGGVGTLAIQIAKARNAHVTVTASADNTEYVLGLGADRVVDYQQVNFAEEVRGVDATLNLVRGAADADLLATVKPGGIIVSLTGAIDADLASSAGVTVIAQQTTINHVKLEELSQLAEFGGVKPNVDQVFTLDEVPRAYQVLKSGEVRGKVIIKIGQAGAA